MNNRLRQLRKEKGLTLKELAEQLNMSFSNIAMIERGERNYTFETAKMFADFFNVSSDYLLGLSDQRNSTSNTYHERLDDVDIEILNDIKNLSDKDKEDLKTIIKYLKVKGEL